MVGRGDRPRDTGGAARRTPAARLPVALPLLAAASALLALLLPELAAPLWILAVLLLAAGLTLAVVAWRSAGGRDRRRR